MTDSLAARARTRTHTAPRTESSRNQGEFRIHFNFPGRAVPDYDDHGYGPLSTVFESFIDPGTLTRMHRHRNEGIVRGCFAPFCPCGRHRPYKRRSPIGEVVYQPALNGIAWRQTRNTTWR